MWLFVLQQSHCTVARTIKNIPFYLLLIKGNFCRHRNQTRRLKSFSLIKVRFCWKILVNLMNYSFDEDNYRWRNVPCMFSDRTNYHCHLICSFNRINEWIMLARRVICSQSHQIKGVKWLNCVQCEIRVNVIPHQLCKITIAFNREENNYTNI